MIFSRDIITNNIKKHNGGGFIVKTKGFGRKGWWVIIYTLMLYLFSSSATDTLNVTTAGHAMVIGGVESSSLLIYAAIGGFVSVPIIIIFGTIVKKCGVKMPTIILLILLAINWFSYGRCHTIVSYAIAATLLSALANTLNLVPTQQLMNNWFPKKKGIALGWATMGMPIDSAISVGIFQYFMNRFGFKTPFYVWAAILVILAVLFVLFVKNNPEEAGAYPDNEPLSKEEIEENLRMVNEYQSPFTIGKLFCTKQFWAVVVIFGFMFMGLVGTISQLVPRLIYVGVQQNTAIMWLTIASVVGIPTSFMWGFIDQKVGTKKTVVIFAVLWTILMALSALGSGTMSIGISIASVIFLSCMHGGMGNLMPSLVIQLFGRYDFASVNRMVVPLVVAIRTFSMLLIPIMIAMAGTNGNVGFRNVFIIFTVLSVISSVCAIKVKNECIGKA